MNYSDSLQSTFDALSNALPKEGTSPSFYRLRRESVPVIGVRVSLGHYTRHNQLLKILSHYTTPIPALQSLYQEVVELANEAKGIVFVVYFCQARTQGPCTKARSTLFILSLCMCTILKPFFHGMCELQAVKPMSRLSLVFAQCSRWLKSHLSLS